MLDIHGSDQSRKAGVWRQPSDHLAPWLPRPLRLTHLCGLGSLCLSRSCLIMRYLPMRMSGLDTFMPFREMLGGGSRKGWECEHQGVTFQSPEAFGD